MKTAAARITCLATSSSSSPSGVSPQLRIAPGFDFGRHAICFRLRTSSRASRLQKRRRLSDYGDHQL